MTHPLVRKELREHFGILLVVWAVCALGLLGLLATARDAGSPLVAWRNLVTVFGPLLSLALANRLVVREYAGRTQLFLETLPMGRAQVIAVKWLTGAACLLAPMAVGLGVILLAAAGEVDLTTGFVGLLAWRGFSFLMFFYSLAFVIGLTGRYRYVLWLALVLLAFIADEVGQLPMNRWPPLQLVAESMSFQRQSIPASWSWFTWIATASLISAAFALALGFQGSWVVAMSRRMSLREGVAIAAIFLCVLFGVMQVEERKAKPPFELQDGLASAKDLPRVMVARADDVSDTVALGLAQRLAQDMQHLREYLGLGVLPMVAVLPDVDIDPDLFMMAQLPESDGVVVRGALGAVRFDEPGFRAFTVARVLDWHSRGRASREERRWLLDGFARWQVSLEDPAQRELLVLRAAVAAALVEVDRSTLRDALRHWDTTRERLGDCLGDALAWRTTSLLAHALGPERFQDFARAMLGVRDKPDVRAYLAEQSLSAALRRAEAPALERLADALRDAAREDGARFADIISPLRDVAATFEAVPMRGTAYEVRYAVESLGLQTAQPFAVRYVRIGPWEGELPRSRLARVDAVAPGVLPTSFARGTRLFTAVEMHVPQLACTVRLGARRWELQ